MPVLELVIDASGVRQGVAQTEAALRTVTAQADKTAASVKTVGASLSGAFQTTGGSVQIAQGIAQTAKSFGELNVAAGAFSASRTILELGNTVRDFQQFRTAIGGTTSAFGALGAVIRANPLGAIATAIGLAATAMQLFGGNSRQAAVDYRTLADELKKAEIEAGARRLLGTFDPSSLAQSRQKAIEQAVGGIQGDGAVPTFADLQRITGLSAQELAGSLAGAGNQSAAQFAVGGSFARPRSQGSGAFARNTDGYYNESDPSLIALSRQQALDVLRNSSYSQQSIINARVPEGTGPYGVGSDPFGLGSYRDPSAGQGVRMDSAQRAQLSMENYNRSLEEQARRLEAARQAGEQFGATIGSALFDAVSGANTLRGALASAISSVARQGFSNGASALAGAVFSAVAGATAKQSKANAGVDPGSLAPNE